MSSSTTLLGLLGDKSYKIWSQNHTSNALNDLSNLSKSNSINYYWYHYAYHQNKYKGKSQFILINRQRRSSIR